MQDAVDKLRGQVLERLKARLRHLAPRHRHEWRREPAAKLDDFEDLFEIRFTADNRAWRPAGFFGPEPGVFTLLVICSKKGNVYNPPQAFKVAARRKASVESGQASTAPLKVDGEDFPPL